MEPANEVPRSPLRLHIDTDYVLAQQTHPYLFHVRTMEMQKFGFWEEGLFVVMFAISWIVAWFFCILVEQPRHETGPIAHQITPPKHLRLRPLFAQLLVRRRDRCHHRVLGLN